MLTTLKVFAREKDRLIFKSNPENLEVILLNSSGKWCSALASGLVYYTTYHLNLVV
jgi:hypothetical protein